MHVREIQVLILLTFINNFSLKLHSIRTCLPTYMYIPYFLEYKPGRLFLSRHRGPGVKTRPAYKRGRRLFPFTGLGARYFNDYYGEPDSRFVKSSVVRGHHVYKAVWTPALREELIVKAEDGNAHDEHAMAVVKEGNVVGHMPRSLHRHRTLEQLPL